MPGRQARSERCAARRMKGCADFSEPPARFVIGRAPIAKTGRPISFIPDGFRGHADCTTGLRPWRERQMPNILKFLAAMLILGGSFSALTLLSDRPGGRFAPLRYLVGAGLVAVSWWFSRT